MRICKRGAATSVSHFRFRLGAVLVDLLKIYPDLKVTALVRNPAHADAIRGLGVEVVQGTFSDTDLITSHARAADITVNAADADDVALFAAILAGHKARVVEDKQPPAVLLHTSGVAVFLDDGKEGKHDPNSKVWNVRPCCLLFWSGSARSSFLVLRCTGRRRSGYSRDHSADVAWASGRTVCPSCELACVYLTKHTALA